MTSPISAFFKLTCLFFWLSLAFIPYACVFRPLKWKYRQYGLLFWKGALRIMRIKVRVRGKLAQDRPLLCVSNHNSYLDILVLGAVFPGTFVSKADVAKWPGIGLLATIARTIYIDRRRESAANHANMMDERMREGEPLLFFPEGTSSDGNRVLPFKSALFKTAESMIDDKPVHVQPVSIAYTKVDGMPVGYVWRPMYAWYGDMDLASHFWQVLMMGKATVEVEFHGTRLLNHDIPASRARKELSKACEDDIRGGVERALTGRHPDQQNPLEDSETRSKQAADDFDDDLDWDDDMQDDAYASAAGAPTRPDTATDK